ncbi:DNA repair protein RecO [Haloimpatiens sp. FM7330]|uniref:DNA repair protein RecO n=1 Tax=Haloimpatiens sp. FM7330 TaxID=3298610 RepID=UPI0036327A10
MGDDFLTIYKTKAIVLKTQDLKENDKLVWLFTEKMGKITAVAKGAKKNRSKFISSTLPFCFGEFVIYRGKSMYTINEVQVIDSFQQFLNNLETLTYTSYLNELIDISMVEQESNRELFKTLVIAYYFIKNNVGDIEILTRAFEVKLLKYTGYELNLDRCCICRKKIDVSNYINFQYYGGVCKECSKSNGIYIRYTAYNVLKNLIKFPLEKCYRINIDAEVKKEIFKVLFQIISQCYQRIPKSLNMFNFFKEAENNE